MAYLGFNNIIVCVSLGSVVHRPKPLLSHPLIILHFNQILWLRPIAQVNYWIYKSDLKTKIKRNAGQLWLTLKISRFLVHADRYLKCKSQMGGKWIKTCRHIPNYNSVPDGSWEKPQLISISSLALMINIITSYARHRDDHLRWVWGL